MKQQTLPPTLIQPTRSPPRPGTTPLSIVVMLLLALIWGLSIPATKFGLQIVPPLILTTMRFAVAVPLLFLLPAGRPGLPVRALPRAAALGVLGIGVGQVAQAFGIQGTAASVGTVISATIPVFVVVFAVLRFKQPVTGRQRIGLLAAFAGVTLVALGHGQDGAGTLRQSSLSGAALMLLSALAISFYYVWSVELTRDFGTAPVAAWSTLLGFLALLPWAGWEAWHTSVHITAEALAVAAYLGVMVSVAGLFLWLHLLRTVPAPVAASVQNLQPVVGIAAAAALFGDRLGPPAQPLPAVRRSHPTDCDLGSLTSCELGCRVAEAGLPRPRAGQPVVNATSLGLNNTDLAARCRPTAARNEPRRDDGRAGDHAVAGPTITLSGRTALSERGVPVLVEKPVADTDFGGKQLASAAEKAGVSVLVGPHRRHSPIPETAREVGRTATRPFGQK